MLECAAEPVATIPIPTTVAPEHETVLLSPVPAKPAMLHTMLAVLGTHAAGAPTVATLILAVEVPVKVLVGAGAQVCGKPAKLVDLGTAVSEALVFKLEANGLSPEMPLKRHSPAFK